jgi:hypothetical protein
VERLESAFFAARALYRSLDSTRGLSLMLLAAMVSALVVVADQLVETWADGHLFAAWVAMWLLGFVALAVFAAPARKLANVVMVALDGWSERLARSRSDARLWALAKADPRIMSDLDAARLHSER